MINNTPLIFTFLTVRPLYFQNGDDFLIYSFSPLAGHLPSIAPWPNIYFLVVGLFSKCYPWGLLPLVFFSFSKK